MKKLLIKVVCILTMVIILLGISVGCNDGKLTDTANVASLDEPTIASTLPTEEPTINPTEITPTATTVAPAEPELEPESTEALYIPPTEPPIYEASYGSSPRLYEPSDFQMRGVIDWNGWTWTYYTEKILPGEGLYLPGRYTDTDGYICDGDGYLCIASTSLSWGTIIDTPFGKQGKVYDSGCAGYILDVYVAW